MNFPSPKGITFWLEILKGNCFAASKAVNETTADAISWYSHPPDFSEKEMKPRELRL
jgi:hypothetical protein